MHSHDEEFSLEDRDEVSVAGPQSRTHPATDVEGEAGVGSSSEPAPALTQSFNEPLEQARGRWEKERFHEEALYRQFEEEHGIRPSRRRPANSHEFVGSENGKYPRSQWRTTAEGGNALWNGLAPVQGQLPSQLPRYQVLCKGHELESDFRDGFKDVDGSWCSAYELLVGESENHGRKREGKGWLDLSAEDQAKSDFLRRGGWHVIRLSEQKREALRERLRTWLKIMPYVLPPLGSLSRGPGKKQWQRTLSRHKKQSSGRMRVIFLYAQWDYTQEQIAAMFGGILGVPKTEKTISRIIREEEQKMELLERLEGKLDRLLEQGDHADAMNALRWQQLFRAVNRANDDEDAKPDPYAERGLG